MSLAGRGGVRTKVLRPGISGVWLCLLALAANVLMPLVVVCRTYTGLALRDVPACCSGNSGCSPAAGGASISTGEVRCPYCNAAAPFRHAHPQWTPTFQTAWVRLSEAPAALFRSRPATPPEILNGPPRAPPPFRSTPTV